jgi:hypothetical protein
VFVSFAGDLQIFRVKFVKLRNWQKKVKIWEKWQKMTIFQICGIFSCKITKSRQILFCFKILGVF